jgi:hypothetical protein
MCSLKCWALTLTSFLIVGNLYSIGLLIYASIYAHMKYLFLMIIPNLLFLIVNVGGLNGILKRKAYLVRNVAFLNILMVLFNAVVVIAYVASLRYFNLDKCAADLKSKHLSYEDKRNACISTYDSSLILVAICCFASIVFNSVFSYILYAHYKQLAKYTPVPSGSPSGSFKNNPISSAYDNFVFGINLIV